MEKEREERGDIEKETQDLMVQLSSSAKEKKVRMDQLRSSVKDKKVKTTQLGFSMKEEKVKMAKKKMASEKTVGLGDN